MSQADLASVAGVGLAVVVRTELTANIPQLTRKDSTAIQSALEAAGVEFVREDGGGRCAVAEDGAIQMTIRALDVGVCADALVQIMRSDKPLGSARSVVSGLLDQDRKAVTQAFVAAVRQKIHSAILSRFPEPPHGQGGAVQGDTLTEEICACPQ